MILQTVFLSSPLSGDVEANIARLKLYVRQAVKLSYAPIVPQLYLPEFVDDRDNRLLAMDICKSLCVCADCFWICGKIISPGMKEELEIRMKHKPEKVFHADFIGSVFVLNRYIADR